jgi:hypothetical protein
LDDDRNSTSKEDLHYLIAFIICQERHGSVRKPTLAPASEICVVKSRSSQGCTEIL